MILFKIYFERDRVRKSGGGAERERGRQRIPSKPCTVSTEPYMGLELMN